MSKKFSIYSKNKDGESVEKVWYDSSNIAYSECIDHDNKPKTLKIVFKNGTQYQYNDVPVGQYLLFREDTSQGKALNRLIKEGKYEYQKLENADLEAIDEELFFRSKQGFYLENNDEFFEIRNNNDESVFKLSKPLEEGYFEMVNDILKSVGIETKIV
ncbi:MAG: KTSC domain-containing protein [Bacilli bacterium]|nr:KTSC domain-containing protein [Bacilli bacterium]